MTELDQWNKIIEDLRGTCQSIIQVLSNHSREDLEDHSGFLGELDQQIFRCESCDWWCELSEESEVIHGCCRDCEPEDGEEE